MKNNRARIRGAALTEYAALMLAVMIIAAGAYKALGRSVRGNAHHSIAALTGGGGGHAEDNCLSNLAPPTAPAAPAPAAAPPSEPVAQTEDDPTPTNILVPTSQGEEEETGDGPIAITEE